MFLKHLARRSAFGVMTVIVVSMIVFFATAVLPGDAARAILGNNASPEALAQLRAQLGLDQPVPAQYLSWIGGVLRGDFGNSVVTRGAVWDLVGPRLGNSLLLLLCCAAVAIPLSFLLGTAMTLRPGGRFDRIANGALMVLAGVPEFVLAIVLILLLSTQFLHLFPSTAVVAPGQSIWNNPAVLVLPVLTLAISVLPYLSRVIRASLVDALASEYVVMARLKGIGHRRVLLRHALRNSLIPSVQAAALTIAYIFGSAIVVEYLFQYPGLGTALHAAVGQRDIYVIQAIVLVISGGYIIFNLAADMLTIALSPRLRT